MPLSRRSKIKWTVFLTVDVLLGAVVLFLFLIRSERDEQLALRELGTSIYPVANQIQPFELTTHDQQTFTEEDLLGQWSLIFYGFTNCPNVCPMSMAELDKFYTQLVDDNAEEIPQVIMATVDPDRDTPAEMTSYVTRFNPAFTGLTGDIEELENLASQLYVVISSDLAEGEMENAMEGDEHAGHAGMGSTEVPEGTFNHSGHISVINPEGQLYAVMRLPHLDQQIMGSYKMLLDR